MDVYIARQPIFDRNLSVFGYELLYRKSMNNFYEGWDDTQATAELINNAFLTMHFSELTEGTLPHSYIDYTAMSPQRYTPQVFLRLRGR